MTDEWVREESDEPPQANGDEAIDAVVGFVARGL